MAKVSVTLRSADFHSNLLSPISMTHKVVMWIKLPLCHKDPLRNITVFGSELGLASVKVMETLLLKFVVQSVVHAGKYGH